MMRYRGKEKKDFLVVFWAVGIELCSIAGSCVSLIPFQSNSCSFASWRKNCTRLKKDTFVAP